MHYPLLNEKAPNGLRLNDCCLPRAQRIFLEPGRAGKKRQGWSILVRHPVVSVLLQESSEMTSNMASMQYPTPAAPQITFLSSSEQDYSSTQAAVVTTATVLELDRRSPPPNFKNRPALRISRTSETEHTFTVRLPGFTPEMVMVSARKENRLAVVADMWHSEDNCHLEWLVAFPPGDVDLAATKAQFSPDDVLTLHVPRLSSDMFITRSRVQVA